MVMILYLDLHRLGIVIAIFIFVSMVLTGNAAAYYNPSYSEAFDDYTKPYFPNGTYDNLIPEPGDIIGYPLGKKPVRHDKVVAYVKELAEVSPIVELHQYAETHEGRPLYYLIISSPRNMSRLADIKSSTGKLADPRILSDHSDVNNIVENTPAIAWMAYSVHGDELSGTDASLQLAYQLAAGTDDLTERIRENVVVLIDPCENPDGRERYLSMLQVYGSKTPNYDKSSVQHNGVWPSGRTNHYLFDLNRDYFAVTQPETKGRVKTIVEWNPQLVVDAHEMWADATFLFSPPRQPINKNTPQNVLKWYDIFSRDQAQAFDRYGWSYYSGDWNEQWFPGYGSAWPTFLGAVGILYEQAGVQGESVLQHDDYLLTYRESVHHQFVSSIANLTTLADNRKEILSDYHQTKKRIIKQGDKDDLTFLFVPDGNEKRMNRFVNSLMTQGIEVSVAQDEFKAKELQGIYESDIDSRTFPAGTYMVSTAQPAGALAKAILEFDPRLDHEFLKKERRGLEKEKDSYMYEASAWSMPLAYGLDAYMTNKSFRVNAARLTEIKSIAGRLINPNATYGFLINNEGESKSLALVELYAENLTIYTGMKPFTIDGIAYNGGSLLIRRQNNPENLSDILQSVAQKSGVEIRGVNTARVEEGYDLGSTKFRLLIEPHIALCTGTPLDWGDFGTLWYIIDHELGIPHSLIEFTALNRSNIDKYNVLIMPSVWGGAGSAKSVLGKHGASRLRDWMRDGGTLICVGNSAIYAADSSSGLSQVRMLRQSFDKLPMYEKMVNLEKRAEAPPLDTMEIWHPERVKDEKEMEMPSSPGNIEYMEKYDQWRRTFHPRGAIMRVNLDAEHWLAFGMGEKVPALAYGDEVLLSGYPVETVGRFSDENSLRLSGLLWPEARERWAESAYVTREGMGKGQLILIARQPYNRAYYQGTRQLLVNAILYGPGLGARAGHYEYDR
ncbi:MAG: hypothetical protein GF315_15155 [candidate division Zixibacteria bacterium]|nr:hypothetical protein [candidate division Zixibacteria bacterium]